MKSITTQIHEIYIKATPERIWEAITKPEWTEKYGYKGRTVYELRKGGSFRAHATAAMVQMGMPDVVIDGEVTEVDPPKKLVQTYRFLFSPEMKAEGFTKITWEIELAANGFSRLAVTHELEGAPIMAAMVSSKFSEMGTGGWAWILSDLKSLLETGTTLGG
jgi:uncharacterized protein YndB with AHSA1/START domain